MCVCVCVCARVWWKKGCNLIDSRSNILIYEYVCEYIGGCVSSELVASSNHLVIYIYIYVCVCVCVCVC